MRRLERTRGRKIKTAFLIKKRVNTVKSEPKEDIKKCRGVVCTQAYYLHGKIPTIERKYCIGKIPTIERPRWLSVALWLSFLFVQRTQTSTNSNAWSGTCHTGQHTVYLTIAFCRGVRMSSELIKICIHLRMQLVLEN